MYQVGWVGMHLLRGLSRFAKPGSPFGLPSFASTLSQAHD